MTDNSTCILSTCTSPIDQPRRTLLMKNTFYSCKILWMFTDLFTKDTFKHLKVSQLKFCLNFDFWLGLAKVFRKFLEGQFGVCPRALCDNQKCIPIGLSEKLRNSRVKIFCPKCDEVYMVQKPKSGGGVQTATNLDGAYFGSAFPQMFLMTFDNMIEQPPKVYLYEP